MIPTPTLMLVEDEADIRDLLQLVLEQAGYRVQSVASAPAALDLLATQPVDLLITDYQLPEMLGTDLVRTVRHRYPMVGVLLMSAQPEVATLAAACGAHAWYRKVTPLETFLAIIAGVLNEQVSEVGGARCCA